MHPQQPKFKLNRNAILIGLISATFPVTAYCIPAGRIDFVIGNVEAVATNGARRPLSKGSEISAGDSINTAAGARAQVRFVDGGYVSLQPMNAPCPSKQNLQKHCSRSDLNPP